MIGIEELNKLTFFSRKVNVQDFQIFLNLFIYHMDPQIHQISKKYPCEFP